MMDTEEAKSNWKHATDKIANQQAVIEAIKDERDRQKRVRKAKKMCGMIVKFLFSTAGLLIINVGYMVLGAFIFNQLEEPNAIENCKNAEQDYYKAENASITLLMDVAQRMDGVSEFNAAEEQKAKDEFQKYLQSFALSVLSNGHDVNNTCDTLGTAENPSDWEFLNSLLFALTIVTTIGYGHIAPGTMWGKLVCIAYALIGMPLYILCLVNVGDAMASVFRLFYSTVCCCGCCKKKSESENKDDEKEKEMVEKKAAEWRIDPETGRPIPPEEGVAFEEEELEEEEEEEEEELTVPLTVSVLWLFAFVFVGTAIFIYYEKDDNWDFTEATYFSFITVSTIGFGDLTPGLQALSGVELVVKIIIVVVYITFGMASVSMCIQLMADEVVAKFKWIGEKLNLSKKNQEEEEKTDESKADITSIKGDDSEV